MVCLLALGRTGRANVQPLDPAPLALETLALSPREIGEEALVKMHRAARLVSPDEARALASSSFQLPDTL